MLRFKPNWSFNNKIDLIYEASIVKKLDECQTNFFNWLTQGKEIFNSKILPTSDYKTLFKSFMVLSAVEGNTSYDYITHLLMSGPKPSLSEIYGGVVETNIMYWHFSSEEEIVQVHLSDKPPYRDAEGFSMEDERLGRVIFCAEYFKYLRKRQQVKVVDNTFSTSTQFARNELLTVLYAFNLIHFN